LRFTPALLALLVVSPLQALAPTKSSPLPPPVAGETIEVSLVDFDAVVTDKKTGQRVHGLTRDDFEVFEDGKRQELTHFAEYASSSPVSEKRTIGIFIEPFPEPENRVRPVYEAMKKTLREVVRPGDAVMIEVWQGGARVALQSTDDVKKASDTLDSIANWMILHSKGVMRPIDGLPSLNAIQSSRPLIDLPLMSEQSPRSDVEPGRSQWGPPQSKIGSRGSTAIRGEAAAVNSFISTMANESGRKILVLMARGLAPAPGAQYFYSVDRNDISRWVGGYDGESVFDAIKATAAERNILVYSFPPGTPASYVDYPYIGMAPNPVIKAYLNRNVALTDLGNATGGGFAMSTEIPKALDRLRDDVTDYYSFAYKAEARHDNRVRKISVRMKNPDYRVRTRRQYIEKNDDSRVRDQVVAAFFQQPAPSGIAVEARLGLPRAKRNLNTIPVSVQIPATSFMTSEDKGAFSIYIATSRGASAPSEITKRTVAFTAADLKQAPGGKLQYDFDLVTNPETSLLSIGVYDEVSHDSGVARVRLPREAR